MRLVFHEAALQDIKKIHEFIAADSPAVARTVIDRIRYSLDRLLDFPKSGRVGTESETYEFVIPNLPYIVIYEINAERIEIIAVFHAAQNRPLRGETNPGDRGDSATPAGAAGRCL
ncbi:MAG: type II toxin-antitoxin system RelE/ParE family toxin [Proteobacteria bacterium]|nr:type II toxin-antitoxin system RelE/ParE family toxin [Pseudomonadota bacterium]